MLEANDALRAMFQVPRRYITIRGNTRSEEVLQLIRKRLDDPGFADKFEPGTTPLEQECLVLEDETALQQLLESGVSHDSVVAIFDNDRGCGNFKFTTCLRANSGMPKWCASCHWGIAVLPGTTTKDHQMRNCAESATAYFNRNFAKNLRDGQYPWGKVRSGESAPFRVDVPAKMQQIYAQLNEGPDLAAAIADKQCALELPSDSKISWYRISHDPLRCSLASLTQAADAMAQFEPACNRLVQTSTEVQEMLMAGVDVDESLRSVYLFPSAKQFSARRPDFHFTGDGVFASENDEMPGGMAELCFLDSVYQLNQERWEACFRFLTEQGKLVFLVSHEWSACYIPEIRWLANHLKARGYDVGFLTTDELEKIRVEDDGVYCENERIGTIWRQFPIFEAHGKLVDLVLAAEKGLVRLIPEFAHYGNKVWFSIFRSHNNFFRQNLPSEIFALLSDLLPDSHLVRSETDFPFSVNGLQISSLHDLQTLPAEARDRLVMKRSGADTMTARSYGVIMGHGLSQQTWGEWVTDRLRELQPFIVQSRLETGVIDLPVMDTRHKRGELFRCRVLLRPWVIGGNLVSVHACAVPSNTLRIHGRVDMCVPPVLLV